MNTTKNVVKYGYLTNNSLVFFCRVCFYMFLIMAMYIKSITTYLYYLNMQLTNNNSYQHT